MKQTNLDLFKFQIILTSVMICFSSQMFFCQTSSLLEVISNDKGAKVDVNSGFNTIKSTKSGTQIFVVSQFCDEKECTIYSYDIVSKENDSLKIEYKKKYGNFFKERIFSISVVDGQFIFICNNNIYIFNSNNEKKLIFHGFIKNEYYFNTSINFMDKIFLQVCYNFHPEDAPYKNVWAIFNPKTLVFEKINILSDNNILFGSFVNSWVDVCGAKICYAQSSSYKITIHNDNFEVIDSISTNELHVNEQYIEKIKQRDFLSKDAISKLSQEDDSLLTRIRKVYFLNDSCVMVLLKLAGKEEVRADYWQKTNHSWNRVFQDYSSIWFEEGQKYSDNQITYGDFYQNVYGFNYDGKLHYFKSYFPFTPIVNTMSFNRDKDFFNKQNDAIIKNELYLGIKEIQINSPFR